MVGYGQGFGSVSACLESLDLDPHLWESLDPDLDPKFFYDNFSHVKNTSFWREKNQAPDPNP